MKKWDVGIRLYTTVYAKTEKEAIEKVYEFLEDQDLESVLPDGFNSCAPDIEDAFADEVEDDEPVTTEVIHNAK